MAYTHASTEYNVPVPATCDQSKVDSENGTEKVECHSRFQPGSEVIKLFSCSAQLRIKFFLLINVKMQFNIYERENSIL